MERCKNPDKCKATVQMGVINIMCQGSGMDMDDPDYYESEDAIIGYECMCCGNVQTTSGMGDTCDRCCGPVCEMYE